MSVVADASPLIALHQVGRLDTLRQLVGEVIVPPAVAADERAARREAVALGLRPLGTLGVLLAAKRRGLIPEIKPLIDELVRQGFWVSPRLVKATLSAAEEA